MIIFYSHVKLPEGTYPFITSTASSKQLNGHSLQDLVVRGYLHGNGSEPIYADVKCMYYIYIYRYTYTDTYLYVHIYIYIYISYIMYVGYIKIYTYTCV